MAFLISTFQLLCFPRYQGGPKFTLGILRSPGRPQRRNFCTQSEYFTISNCVFNFNILALLVSDILGGSQIYVRGPCAPLYAPQRNLFCTRGEYVTMSNGVFNFNFLAVVFSEILRGSQIYTRGPYAPWTPPRGEIFLPKASTSQYLIVFLISTFQLQQFPRFQGVPNLRQEALCPPVRPQRNFFCTRGEYVTMYNGVFNLNFLALLLSDILGGPKFTPPGRPLAENFFYQKRVLHNI